MKQDKNQKIFIIFLLLIIIFGLFVYNMSLLSQNKRCESDSTGRICEYYCQNYHKADNLYNIRTMQCYCFGGDITNVGEVDTNRWVIKQ